MDKTMDKKLPRCEGCGKFAAFNASAGMRTREAGSCSCAFNASAMPSNRIAVSFSIIGSCSMGSPHSKYSEPRMLSCGGVGVGGGEDGGTRSSEFFKMDSTLL